MYNTVYKRKAALLSALVLVLSAIYIFSFVFDPERRKANSFAWLEGQFQVMADRIEISGVNGKTELIRKNNVWFISSENRELPVKQGRVEDLFNALSARDVYPLRASSQEARERLALVEGRASRIVIYGGAGLPLLDLLIGTADSLGKEIYLRRAGWNEIYSGEDRFTYFTDAKPASWYDLRLFPFEDQRPDSVETVQQAEVKLPDGDAYVLRRRGNGWIVLGDESASVDTTRLEAWLRTVLEAEGNGFGFAHQETVEGSVTLRFGDGSSRTIQAGPADDKKNRNVSVSVSSFIYVLEEWNYNRLFRKLSYFLKT